MAEFRKTLNIFLPFFLIILNPTFLYADITDTISVTNLVETVLKTDQEDTPEVPKVLSDIVNEYYAEVVIPDSVPALVLDYIGSIFCVHGYEENGNFVEFNKKSFTYIPYAGELPEYTRWDFHLPVDGRITSGFGYRPQFNKFHKGIDIALKEGDFVKTVLPGVVRAIGYDPGGYGNYIIVSHKDNLETVYGHLEKIEVQTGQLLEKESIIGIGGSTGKSTGPHLHFETRYMGVAVDPIFWFELEDL